MEILSEIKGFVKENKSQAHLYICNTKLFNKTISNGVYGFPHQGKSRKKSFWRAVASMYNIGPNDLIFLYITNGKVRGCKEIHGPFKVYDSIAGPAIYYDLNSNDFPMLINDRTDCKVRFLFENLSKKVYSITDKYKVIQKYETKEILGYRYPSVMNIGAVRKKSVTSFTSQQTLVLLDLMSDFGEVKYDDLENIPKMERVEYFSNLDDGNYHFILDDDFLLNTKTNDEAFIYAYLSRGFKNTRSQLYEKLINDFSAINDDILRKYDKTFEDLSSNVMMEVVISPHL